MMMTKGVLRHLPPGSSPLVETQLFSEKILISSQHTHTGAFLYCRYVFSLIYFMTKANGNVQSFIKKSDKLLSYKWSFSMDKSIGKYFKYGKLFSSFILEAMKKICTSFIARACSMRGGMSEWKFGKIEMKILCVFSGIAVLFVRWKTFSIWIGLILVFTF